MDKNRNAIIQIGRLLWEKDLTAATSGNISLKIGKDKLLITAHNSCLGWLTEKEIIVMNLEGESHQDKEPTTEKPLHLAIHKRFKHAAVIHAHPPYINGYFAVQDKLENLTFESRLILGDVPCVKQETPSVTDVNSVLKALENSNIVVLKNHGAVAIGDSLSDTFFLIQLLEEAIKVNVVAKFYSNKEQIHSQSNKEENISKFEMFSDEHIKTIVDLVNQNEEYLKQAKAMAVKTKLAIKMEETGKVFCFTFDDGKIVDISNSEKDAEFVISGSGQNWRKIFNRELDPFVATTQKKLILKGDFGKISRWYSPFNKLFEVWRKVGVK